ncbi:MAG: hypothetical protein H7A51_15600 [Akkermansiaceae bacterium]|nr:hypothetical protein [Akkermansiaceae bacterium]
MSEEASTANQPAKKKAATQVSRLAGCLVIGLVLLFFGVVVFGSTILVEIPYHLAVGWVFFLLSNVRALELNWEMAACGVGALLLAVFGFHRFLIWVRKDKPWKWSWTVSMTAMMLMLFAASISMTGIIHQLGWMAREPLTQSSNRALLTVNVSNAKQIFYSLVEYEDEHGQFPDHLQALVIEGLVSAGAMEELSFHPERERATEPWIYLGEGKSFFDGSEKEGSNEYPLIISPRPVRGKWVVLRIDGAVTSYPTQSLMRKYPWLAERLPNLFADR